MSFTTSQATEKPTPSAPELAQRYRELADDFLAATERLQGARDDAVAVGKRLLDEIGENEHTAVDLDSALRDELEYAVGYIAGNGSVFEFDAALREARNIAALAAAVAARNAD